MRMQFSAPLPVKVRPGAGSQCPARFPLQRDEGSVDRHPQRLSAAQWRRAESFLLGRAGWVGVTAKHSRNFVTGVPLVLRGGAQWKNLPLGTATGKASTSVSSAETGPESGRESFKCCWMTRTTGT